MRKKLMLAVLVLVPLTLVVPCMRWATHYQHREKYGAYLREANTLLTNYSANVLHLNRGADYRTNKKERDALYQEYLKQHRELRERYGLSADADWQEGIRWLEGVTPWDR